MTILLCMVTSSFVFMYIIYLIVRVDQVKRKSDRRSRSVEVGTVRSQSGKKISRSKQARRSSGPTTRANLREQTTDR
jgi:hypothetical protein